MASRDRLTQSKWLFLAALPLTLSTVQCGHSAPFDVDGVAGEVGSGGEVSGESDGSHALRPAVRW
jgi:hypothetical protein